MDDPKTFWTILLAAVDLVVAVGATLHVVLKKRETQTVIGWVGLVWLAPLIGGVLYYCFGINRIGRRGSEIQRGLEQSAIPSQAEGDSVDDLDPEEFPYDRRLARVVERITCKPLLPGNRVLPLVDGETAYPRMLAAIAAAEKSISFSAYIVDNDRAGREFVDALVEAQRRGVEVRVLIDDIGARYSRPSIVKVMRRGGLTVRTFLPTFVPRAASYANLRNHRKILVLDGKVGFTGGMNIRAGCRADWGDQRRVRDIHFLIEGPAVMHLQEVFATDWAFTSRERLQGDLWFPQLTQSRSEGPGDLWARGIADGPDANLDNIRLTLLAAITAARERIDIVTPYFLPDNALVSALNVASMRGVWVRILIPERNNIRLVEWAAMDPAYYLLQKDCEIYLSPPPFDHSKIMLIDEAWSLIGSSNWDPRSLRLNFEFNVECYGRSLNEELSALVDSQITRSRRLMLADLIRRPLPLRIRDGLARLATPYL